MAFRLWNSVPPSRRCVLQSGLHLARRRNLKFPALPHHGMPRERLLLHSKLRAGDANVARGGRRQRAAGAACVARDVFTSTGMTRRARAGSAGPTLLTWLPRGQWSGTDRNRGEGLSAPDCRSWPARICPALQLPAKSKPYLASRVYQITPADDPSQVSQSPGHRGR
jgi:hypothetical protein